MNAFTTTFSKPTSVISSNTITVTCGTTYRRFIRVMLTIIVPFFLNMGLSSCAQPDTINPQTGESVATASAREAATIVKKDGFEDGKLGTGWYNELWSENAGKLVTNQVRVGERAMRFSWKPSQFDGTNNSCHAELASGFLDKKETERWYGFSVYLPAANNADDAEIANIVQWHAFPEPGYAGSVPPINLTLEANNQLTLGYRASNVPITKFLQHATSQKIMKLGTISYDRWIDFVVHVKLDPNGKEGILQLWQDGQLKVNEQGVSIGYVNTRNYWKFGLYCWSGKATHNERVAYFDEVRIGMANSSYNAVKPGRDNNTAR